MSDLFVDRSQRHRRPLLPLHGLIVGATLCVPAGAQAKPFMDYLKPTPVTCSPLSSATWGEAGVLPRDLCNGIESAKGSAVPPEFYYWDGQILKAQDGKYHLFMSTWSGTAGFNPGWQGSDAYHAISATSVLGPYERKDYVYTNNGSHKGHNVSALELPDGSYAVVVSETVPFTIYKSSSLDGPWTGCQAQIQTNGLSNCGDNHVDSNVSLVARHDGKYQIVQRHGIIAVADTLCGPYAVQKPTWTYPAANRPTCDTSIYPKRTSIPGVSNPTFAWEEDPHIWRSGGVYHVIYSGSGDRVGYHLYSTDGLTDWTDNGYGWSPREYQKIFCYEGGTTCSQWYKMERPGVVLEGGHPTHITWAVADVDKDNQIPAGSNHGSKVIVVPFDGVAFDADFGRGGMGGAGGSAGAAGAVGTGGVTGSGGAPVTGGSSGSGTSGSGGTSTGGVSAGGATAGMAATAGSPASTGGAGTGGANTGGSSTSGGSSGSGTMSAGGSSPSGGARVDTGGSSASGGFAIGGRGGSAPSTTQPSTDNSGCGCVLPSASRDRPPVPGPLLVGFGLLMARRRRTRKN